jgi:hypothetical protein
VIHTALWLMEIGSLGSLAALVGIVVVVAPWWLTFQHTLDVIGNCFVVLGALCLILLLVGAALFATASLIGA